MSILHMGESVFTASNDPEARMPEPWCPYSATCYKARTPVHDVMPLSGKPYVDGCPRDFDRCPSALIASGHRTYEETSEHRQEMERLVGWRVCKRCGRWFRYARGGAGRRPVYCSDVCRGAAEVDRQKKRRGNG